MSAGSVAFDRAVDYYDRTRAISAEAEAALVAQLMAEIRDRRVMEIGVGTGRIAWPLRAAGVDVVGLDLSRPMLERLVDKAAASPFPVLQGDCTRLPCRAGAFGVVVASHVFHLVADWPTAVAEVQRVVAPAGVLLVTRGGWQGLKHDVATYFTEETGIHEKPPPVGLDDVTELDGRLGAGRWLDVIIDRQQVTLDGVIGMLERGQLAWMWDMDPEVLATAGRRTRVWAEETYGVLDEPREQVSEIQWRAYDF